MKKIKLFSKILTLITTISVLSVPVCAEDTKVTYTNPEPYVNEDYSIFSEGFDCTFKELLEMNDEEFMELDKYKGKQSADTMSWHVGYKNICTVLGGQYLNMENLANNINMNVEELTENILDNKIFDLSEYDDEYEVAIPFYTDALYSEKGIMDSKCILIKSLTNTFCINSTTDFRTNTEENGNAELNQKIDAVWLAKQLNEYFGDEIEFKCFEEVDVDTKESVGRINIEFDMDDKLSFNKENVLYSAKILSCLLKINNVVSPEKNYSYSKTEQVEIFDSTTKVGDDGDSTITVRDCVEIAGKLSKADDSLSECVDYNLDQKVNIRDAAAIAKQLSEK